MTEIIYFDIDGTLRNECEGITDKTVFMIEQCRARGIRTVICTGRNPKSIQDDVLSLGTDGTISGGGCFIYFNGSLLKEVYFPEQEVKQLFREIYKMEIAVAAETKQGIYMNQKAAEFYEKDYEWKLSGRNPEEYSRVKIKNKINYQNNFSQLCRKQEDIHKICLLGERGEIERFAEKYRKTAEIIQKKEWNSQWYLELLPQGNHKGAAVTFLNQWLGIPKENSMGFGDGSNDLDMLHASGISVAIKNGCPELIAYADSVCDPPEKDGIYKELVKRGIIM